MVGDTSFLNNMKVENFDFMLREFRKKVVLLFDELFERLVRCLGELV